MSLYSRVQQKLGFVRPHRLTLLSALLLILTFEPLHLYPLAFVALVPWMFALKQSPNRKSAFWQGFWLCFLFCLVTFFWVALVIHQFAFIPLPIALIALMLFACVGQPQFFIAGVVLREFLTAPRFLFLKLIGVALFYSGLDWLMPKLFVDTLGHALFYSDTLKQIADIGGPSLITFLCMLSNVAIFNVCDQWKSQDEPSIWGGLKNTLPFCILAIASIVASYSYGKQRLELVEQKMKSATRSLNVAMIQANIGDIDKIAAERGFRNALKHVMGTFYDLTDQALAQTPKPDFVVWPETSYPSAFKAPDSAEDQARDEELERFVKSRKFNLVFGGYDQDPDRTQYNTLFYLDAKTNLQKYHKTILLMFGEYIPGAEWFPAIKSLFPMVGFFGKGDGSVIREIQTSAGVVKTQPIICYEALFPNFMSKATRDGSQLILNVTNDSWFGRWYAPLYHFNLATFRSIEMRVPQLRATNTGYTALILPTGQVTEQSELFVPKIVNVKVPLIEPIPTLIKKWGDWFAGVALGLSIIIGFFVSRNRNH